MEGEGGVRLTAPVGETLDREIRAVMAGSGLPSLAVALVDRDGVVWSAAYGYSNLWARTPATTETVYLIGSTFKAQSALALLQLMERGRFRLDDPVRPWLAPFGIRRERPEHPVTFRQLLTHTAGLPAAFGAHSVWGETAPPPLDAYVRDSLELVARPGTEVVYSNMGYALVGWLVERLSGQPYADYVRDRVWAPLRMTSTAFAPSAAMGERLAVPYLRGPSGALEPTTWLKANVWPAGVVYGTVLDQARWLSFNLGDGRTPDGERLVERSTLEAMQSLQDDALPNGVLAGWGYEDTGYGLGWWATTRAGERFFAHSGGVPGYTSFLMGSRERGLGVALLSNGNQADAALARLASLVLDLVAPTPARVVEGP
jgi:CubicO group peptidase (beta-lactamase class C family)